MFTIFISKKQDSEGKAWLPQTVLHQPLSMAPGSPRSTPQSVAWKVPQVISPSNQCQVSVWKVDSPMDTFRAKNSSFKRSLHQRRLRKENPDILRELKDNQITILGKVAARLQRESWGCKGKTLRKHVTCLLYCACDPDSKHMAAPHSCGY